MRFFTICLLLFIFFGGSTAYSKAQALEVDSKSAVILAYSRINEDNYSQSSLRIDDFKSHILEIKSGDYNVIPLPELIDALHNAQDLPERTIAITFEGGYKSAYELAIPLLLEHEIPFTVFFSSDNAELDSGEYMDWADIKWLKRQKGVSFGILPSSYQRIHENTPETNKRYLNNAKIAFREHFGKEAELLSYPFGEYSKSYKELLKQHGIKAAFGLQSGVAYAGMDFLNIPRFTMTDGFGDLQRFRMITNSYPIPAIDVEPENHVLSSKTPLFGFSIPQDSAKILSTITCFISGHGQADTFIAGENRLEIRPRTPLDEGRVRINCTANSGTAEEPKWRWFGMLYTITNTQ